MSELSDNSCLLGLNLKRTEPLAFDIKTKYPRILSHLRPTNFQRLRNNMSHGRLLAWVLASIALSACVSSRTVSLSGASSLSGKSIAHTRRLPPDFALNKQGIPVGALFGPIGGAVVGLQAISAGNKLVADNHIEDPAPGIQNTLLQQLASSYHLNITVESPSIVKTWKPEEVAKLYPDSDLVLDVGTVAWAALPYPTTFSPYHLLLNIRLTLIDAKTGKAVAEALCKHDLTDASDRMSYDEMVGNEAARLKASIGTASQQCLVELRTKIGIA